MQSPEQRLAGLELVEAPKKWKDRWSGPHRVTHKVKDKTGFRYTFYHKERGKAIDTHVNKLALFQPWSAGLPSTSWDIDAKRLFKSGGWAKTGELVLVPLERPHPFGIAKILQVSIQGDLTLQWYGNGAGPVIDGERICDTKGTYLPGWTGPRVRKPYYQAEPRREEHLAFTAGEGARMNQRDVLIHGFELTKSNRLPSPLIRAIAKEPYIWWDPYEHGHVPYSDAQQE
jgi:hypothetical protein